MKVPNFLFNQNIVNIIFIFELDHFHDWFEPELQKFGYSGFFQPKLSSPCLKYSLEDGCAIFFKSKFEVVSGPTVFNYPRLVPTSEAVLYNQIALSVLFRHCSDNSLLLLCTTHLKAGNNLNDEETRKIQSTQLIEHLGTISAIVFDMVWKINFHPLVKGKK